MIRSCSGLAICYMFMIRVYINDTPLLGEQIYGTRLSSMLYAICKCIYIYMIQYLAPVPITTMKLLRLPNHALIPESMSVSLPSLPWRVILINACLLPHAMRL